MSRKNEREFVGGDMSDEDYAALNGDSAGVVETMPDEPAPEPVTDAQGGDPAPAAPEGQPAAENAPQGQPEPKMVDVRALQEARAELRKRDEELRKRDEEFARADERIRVLQEAWQKQQQPEAPKVPSLEDEPIEFFQHQIKSLEEKLSAREKAEAEREEQTRFAREQQSHIDQADAVLGRAIESHTDLAEAFTFAFKAVNNEINRTVSQRNDLNDYQKAVLAQQMLDNERVRYAKMCPRDPNEAAEFVRRNARYWGWGYQQPQPAAEQQPAPAQAAAPVVAPPTIQERQQQQQRHMSLSGVPGSEAPKPLSAKDLASMPEKQYEELLKTAAGRKQLEEAFGGV